MSSEMNSKKRSLEENYGEDSSSDGDEQILSAASAATEAEYAHSSLPVLDNEGIESHPQVMDHEGLSMADHDQFRQPAMGDSSGTLERSKNRRFSPEEDELLRSEVQNWKEGQRGKGMWSHLGSILNRRVSSIVSRCETLKIENDYHLMSKNGATCPKSGRFSKEEDEMIRRMICEWKLEEKGKGMWGVIATTFSRSIGSIKVRYSKYLKTEEFLLLMSEIREAGIGAVHSSSGGEGYEYGLMEGTGGGSEEEEAGSATALKTAAAGNKRGAAAADEQSSDQPSFSGTTGNQSNAEVLALANASIMDSLTLPSEAVAVMSNSSAPSSSLGKRSSRYIK